MSRPEFPEDAEVDPRVEDELEKMNVVAQQLNEMETLLQQARQQFRTQLSLTAARLEEIQSQTGSSCVEKARPYYEAKRQCKLLQAETQAAALRYERSCEMLATAKSMVRTAESSCPPTDRGGQVDENWALMLNQATEKVNLAEKDRRANIVEHASLTDRFARSQQRVLKLENNLKSVIKKSRPYFEVNARCQQALVEQKQHVEVYEEKVRICKRLYDEALRTLEAISEEIHERRKNEQQRRAVVELDSSTLGERGECVGAEDPPQAIESLESAASDIDESAAAPLAKPRKSKCLRSSVVTPIMTLLQDTMREHAKENARLEQQQRHLTASPTNSAASSLDDETLAEFVSLPDQASGSSRSNSPAIVAEQQRSDSAGSSAAAQRKLVLAPDLKKFLDNLNR